MGKIFQWVIIKENIKSSVLQIPIAVFFFLFIFNLGEISNWRMGLAILCRLMLV